MSKVLTTHLSDTLCNAVAETAVDAFKLRGCLSPNLCDARASSTLAAELHLGLLGKQRSITVAACEGIKDNAPMMVEGQLLGADSMAPSGLLLADPLECTRALAFPDYVRERGSMVIAAFAPTKSVRRMYSGCRAKKLVIPPGVCAEPQLLNRRPAEIIACVCQGLGAAPSDITVGILDRPRNKEAIAGFQSAGAQVTSIGSGDFEEHILAAKVPDGGRLRLSYGIGGYPEGLLAVPFVQMTGAQMFVEIDPLRDHRQEICDEGNRDMLGRVHTAHELIKDDDGDTLLVVAGITDSGIVAGVQPNTTEAIYRVSVLVASPAWKQEEKYTFHVQRAAARRSA